MKINDTSTASLISLFITNLKNEIDSDEIANDKVQSAQKAVDDWQKVKESLPSND